MPTLVNFYFVTKLTTFPPATTRILLGVLGNFLTTSSSSSMRSLATTQSRNASSSSSGGGGIMFAVQSSLPSCCTTYVMVCGCSNGRDPSQTGNTAAASAPSSPELLLLAHANR